MGDNATVKSDVASVAFEKMLDGVGRAEIESRYRRAVFDLGEAITTLTAAQEKGTALHDENVALKNSLRVARILLENGKSDRALDCIRSALSPPLDEVPSNEDAR